MTRSGILTILLCLFSWIFAKAQERVFEYSDQTGLTEFMDVCYFLTDSSYFQQQSPPLTAAFQPSDAVDFDAIGKTYWMRFSIHNQEDHQVKIQLFVGLSEVLDFYIPEESGYLRHPIGTFESRRLVRKISGEGKSFLSQAALTIEAGQTNTFYAYFNHLSSGMQAQRDAKIAPRLLDKEIWEEKNGTTIIIWSFLFGCFLIMMLYHFVYYYLTKDDAYLYYCLFVFSVSFPFLTLLVDFADKPENNAILFFSISGLFSVFYFQLTRKLIPIAELLPKWDRILKKYITVKTVLVLAYCILYWLTTDIFLILGIYIPAFLVEIILMVLLAYALLKTNDRVATLFVIGSLIAWAGMFISLINSEPSSSFTPQINPFKFATPAYGFVLESLFFAMVLAFRARLNEVEKKEAKDALILQLQENDKLQTKVTRELEGKVVERTTELREQKEEAERLKERAERSEQFKEQFLANMSHEIRTPMHAISGMTKILRRNNPPQEQTVFLDAIHKSSDNLLVILNDILDLSKIEAGKLEIESIPINPTEVINEVVDILKFKAEEKGLILEVNIDEQIPEVVISDPTRLNQILINLTGNAIKFTETGKVSINLQIVEKVGTSYLRYAVKDSGIGIPADKLNTIFSTFSQVDDTTTRKYGGTGLGLSITKQLVELQGGTIWAVSEEGQGSIFYLDLPMLVPEEGVDGKTKISEEELAALGQALKGTRILIAEDNPFNIMVAEDDLSFYIPGVLVDTAANGKIAAEMYQQNSYDLILMDIQMPVMNGRDASQKIREWETQAQKESIPIIAMTASLLKSEIDLCLKAGMNNYIPKPYNIEELIGTIHQEAPQKAQ